MRDHWQKKDKTGNDVQEERVVLGILEREAEPLYLRITQIPADEDASNQVEPVVGPANTGTKSRNGHEDSGDDQRPWATVSVEYWNLRQRNWVIDNKLQIDMSRTQFNIFEDEDDFNSALTTMQRTYDNMHGAHKKGGEKPSGMEGQS